jgi:23S rRNA (cytosine1962-C5)-methyltransferase
VSTARSGAPARRTPRRYQLTKEAVGVVASGHPWVFRSHVSSALAAFPDGQWLSLVDGKNRVVGFGVYEAAGAVAIRVLQRGDARPDAAGLGRRIDAALARRATLRTETNAWRALHGENDGLPGVVVDVLGDVVVVQAYSAGVRALARWAGARVAAHAGAAIVVVDVAHGQKSGAFLDLRGLRRWVRAQPLAGASVLNLFSFTGMCGVAAARAGATSITHVDASAAALAWGRAHHGAPGATFVEADIFAWLPAQAPGAHQLVIVDPPSMTSRAEQVPAALAAYRRLHAAAAPHVAPGGALVVACCTSRIGRDAFRSTAVRAIGPGFSLEQELAPEPDHPVGFPQGDYLKVLVFRRAA